MLNSVSININANICSICCLKVSLLSIRTPSNLNLSVKATSLDPTLINFNKSRYRDFSFLSSSYNLKKGFRPVEIIQSIHSTSPEQWANLTVS